MYDLGRAGGGCGSSQCGGHSRVGSPCGRYSKSDPLATARRYLPVKKRPCLWWFGGSHLVVCIPITTLLHGLPGCCDGEILI